MAYPRWRAVFPAQTVLAPGHDSLAGGCCCRIQIHATNSSRITASIHSFVYRPPVQNPACPMHTVGGAVHQELWIPAEDLAEMNRNIVGLIEVIAEFKSDTEQRK